MEKNRLGLNPKLLAYFFYGFLALSSFSCLGCGVKGKPLAPLEPEPFGYGRPEYPGTMDLPSDETEGAQETKAKKKKGKEPRK